MSDSVESAENGAGLISISEAVARGIERVRQRNWVEPRDYVKLDIFDGRLGPWLHLYSPLNEVIGAPNPQNILWVTDKNFDKEDKCLEEYTGPIDAAEK